jgi:hypothetical protein
MLEGAFRYVKTVAGPDRLSPAERKRHWELLEIIRLSRETLDPEPLIAVLSENVAYDSQSIQTPLNGRDAVADYFRGRFEFFRSLRGKTDLGRFIPATIGLPQGANYPCLIFEVGGDRQAIYHLGLSDAGLIQLIQILTVAPPPFEAIPLIKTGDPNLAFPK